MTIPALVEGGKASAGPPLGPALGPAGVNIGQVIAKINEKTKDFAGMSVPVTVIVDSSTKEFEIEVGTPPVSALVKKEAGIAAPVKEEAGVKGKKTIGNISIDQALKICRMKTDGTLAGSTKAQLKEVAGTCLSLGVTIEKMNPKQFIAEVNAGKYDSKIK